jgi:hypothetical protein
MCEGKGMVPEQVHQELDTLEKMLANAGAFTPRRRFAESWSPKEVYRELK